MKSVEIAEVKTSLERTTRGFTVARGSWSVVEFVNYEDADAFFVYL